MDWQYFAYCKKLIQWVNDKVSLSMSVLRLHCELVNPADVEDDAELGIWLVDDPEYVTCVVDVPCDKPATLNYCIYVKTNTE